MTDLSKMSHAELKAQSARDKKTIDEAPDRLSRLMAKENAKLTLLEWLKRNGWPVPNATEPDCVRGDLTEINELPMGRERMWQIKNFILNSSRANIIIKVVEKRKICNLPLLVPAMKRKDFSTRKKQKSANRISRAPKLLEPFIVISNWGKDYLLPIANYPLWKSPRRNVLGLFVWGWSVIGLLIFCFFQNLPKLRHSIFG